MDHSRHIQLEAAEINEANLVGAAIYGRDDEKIGAISHVHGTGPATKVVVDAGGFLGIGSKQVALTASQLSFMRDESGVVHAVTSWTKEQVKDLPEHYD